MARAGEASRVYREEPTEQKAREIARRAVEAGKNGDLERAAELFAEQLTLTPDDPWAMYNLARCLAGMGRSEEAWSALDDALRAGFDDVRRLRRDAMLAPALGEPGAAGLEDRWPGVLEAARERRVLAARDVIAGAATEVIIEGLRVVLIADREDEDVAAAVGELERVAAWSEGAVFPGLRDAGEAALDPWAVVVLPRGKDFERWARGYLGTQTGVAAGLAGVGGAYDHETRTLVARDLGPTLRHEFMHLLHWRMCMRSDQAHPVWLQEGLCTLMEDVEVGEGGLIRPVASWRTNIAKRMASAGLDVSLAGLMAGDRGDFLGARPLAWYARARAAFLFLHERGVLGAWYSAFERGARGVDWGDGSRLAAVGRAAFEEALGKPMERVEREFRVWLRELRMMDEEVPAGGASLGVEVEPGDGAGPVVVGIVLGEVGVGELREGDVILGIDGASTRDIPELVRVLGGYAPGDRVRVSVRRGDVEREVRVELRAR